MDSLQRQQIQLGFLTIRKHPTFGFVGGLLVVNGLARPIEFHCTLPLQTTRAQQILFGATLDEFVSGEQIGRALMLKAKSQPSLFLTDALAALSVRHLVDSPIAAIDAESGSTDSNWQLPPCTTNAWNNFSLGDYQLRTLEEYASDKKQIEEILSQIDIDLIEPFGRIEGALLEAHPASKAA
jgi:hypothetical protein